MSLILDYIRKMLPYVAALLPLVIIWRVLRAQGREAQGQPTIKREIALVVFVLWMVGLLSQAIIPQFFWIGGKLQVVGGIFSHPWENLNLILGKVFVSTYRSVFEQHEWSLLLINFIGNIVMFMPIGFLMPLLWKRFASAKNTALAGLCLSLFIELCQLPLTRKTDIDDLWLNTLGVWLGYCLWKVRKICRKPTPLAGNKEGHGE